MKLTAEQLLQPRYEVIAPYPLMPYNVGDFLHRKNSNSTLYEIMNVSDVVYFDEEDIANHPNLFRKLEWWEKRSVKDMPDYVKGKSLISGNYGVVKIDNWQQFDGWWKANNKHVISEDVFNLYEYIEPATETDYQNYLNQTK